MKRVFFTVLLSVCAAVIASAQEKVVQNRPYTDLRPFHFGIVVGTHLQDIEFENVGPQTVTFDDGTQGEKLITCDQDRWDPGFTVGVLGEARLHKHFSLRASPTLLFGNRHLTFRNFTDKTEDGNPQEKRQDMKTIYIGTPVDLIFSAERFNNHRPYLMAGVMPMLNLSGKDEDIVKLKKFDCYVEVGIGCDFYLPFFKFRPELKFAYSLTNALDTDHTRNMKDRNMMIYSNSVRKAQTKIIALTLNFE